MVNPNPEIQRASRQVLTGVVGIEDLQRVEEKLELVKTEVEAIRADVVPISAADLHTNADFLELLNTFETFKAKYGVEAKDLDLNQNPIFAALENRVDVLENIVTSLQAEITAIKAQLPPKTP